MSSYYLVLKKLYKITIFKNIKSKLQNSWYVKLKLVNAVKSIKIVCIKMAKHYNFTTDKVCHSLKFIMQPVVIEPRCKAFDFGYKS